MSSRVLTMAAHVWRLSSSSARLKAHGCFRSRSSLTTALWEVQAAWSAVRPSGRRKGYSQSPGWVAWLSKWMVTVVIVQVHVQLLPGPRERLPDGLDVDVDAAASDGALRRLAEEMSGFSPAG